LDGSAGIGTARGNSLIEELTIEDANVTGTSSTTSGNYGGPRIGTGSAYYNGAKSRIGNLRIEKSTVTGTGSISGYYGGSGIGTGAADNGDSSIGPVLLSGSLM
jgi:hypothetical protein